MKIKIKRKKSLYDSLIEKWGDADGRTSTEINGFGIKIFPDGTQFVINAKTGKPIQRTRQVRYLGQNGQGLNFYIPEDETLGIGEPIPSFQR